MRDNNLLVHIYLLIQSALRVVDQNINCEYTALGFSKAGHKQTEYLVVEMFRDVHAQRTIAQCAVVRLYVRAIVLKNENIWLRTNAQNGILFTLN